MQSFETGSQHFKGSNPFSTIPISSSISEENADGEFPLASRLKRFTGLILDLIIPVFCLLPGILLVLFDSDMFAAQSVAKHRTLGSIGMVWMLIVGLVGIVLHFYLLTTRSQSIGKFLLKIQIHSIGTNQPANFVRTFLLRGVLNGLITGLLGYIHPYCLVYQVVDACFILREDRRCLHDLMAGTKVVDIS